MTTSALRVFGLALFFAVGCVAGDYDGEWGGDFSAGGKADGLFDATTAMEFGQSYEGSVTDTSLMIYSLDLKRADGFKLVVKRTSGDLVPSATLFAGVSTQVRSESYSVKGGTLTKQYKVTQSNRYYIALRAYQGATAGGFSITATCTDGPCAGQPLTGEDLSTAEKAECIGKARQCAFDKLTPSLTKSRARTIFMDCLNASSTDDGISCGPSCDADESGDAKELCNDMIDALPFYGKKDAECLEILDECLSSCAELGDDDEGEEFYSTNVAVCWSTGYNGSCDRYARAIELCGGKYEYDSPEGACLMCYSTDGAQVDDLDDLCEEACAETTEGELDW